MKRLAFLFVLGAHLACTSSVVQTGSPGASGGASSSSSSSTSSSSSSSSSSGAPPQHCGDTTCAPDEFCANADCKGDTSPYATNYATATCMKRPTTCMPGSLACGCDGKIYPSACEANRAGSAAQPADACKTPAGMFPCYETYCDQATEYCDFESFALVPMAFGCVKLPACNGPICPCIEAPDFSTYCNGATTTCTMYEGGWLLHCDQT